MIWHWHWLIWHKWLHRNLSTKWRAKASPWHDRCNRDTIILWRHFNWHFLDWYWIWNWIWNWICFHRNFFHWYFFHWYFFHFWYLFYWYLFHFWYFFYWYFFHFWYFFYWYFFYWIFLLRNLFYWNDVGWFGWRLNRYICHVIHIIIVNINFWDDFQRHFRSIWYFWCFFYYRFFFCNWYFFNRYFLNWYFFYRFLFYKRLLSNWHFLFNFMIRLVSHWFFFLYCSTCCWDFYFHTGHNHIRVAEL